MVRRVCRLLCWPPRRPMRADELALAKLAAQFPRSVVGGELDLDVSRARLTTALTAAGLTPDTVILRRDQGAPVAHVLVEVEGFLADGDVRLVGLAGVLRQPIVLGAYAIPEAGGAA